jgi:hypothetical protein
MQDAEHRLQEPRAKDQLVILRRRLADLSSSLLGTSVAVRPDRTEVLDLRQRSAKSRQSAAWSTTGQATRCWRHLAGARERTSGSSVSRGAACSARR